MEQEHKQLVIGILAHVDSGKTTLSEALLYGTGTIRKLGRVDHKDAFLDTDALEKARGITIFSKQALFTAGNTDFTLLDTPGHVDFSTETERTLQVLDYAVLVVSGTDGVQSHTETLWRLLRRYHIPTFVFVNKMDLPGPGREALLTQLNRRLGDGFVDFGAEQADRDEALALCDERLMEAMLDRGILTDTDLIPAIARRHVFPCWFGSALKLQGVDTLVEGLDRYTRRAPALEAFGAKVFKVSQDEQGNRLTWLRVTGGVLKVKAQLTGEADGEPWAEKANQLRLYSGAKFTLAECIGPGQVCAVTGLTKARPGEGLGAERDSDLPVLEPVLSYQVLLPEGADVHAALGKLHRLEEEEPQLHVVWNETLGEIHVQLMGEVQLEVLKSLLAERYGLEVSFGPGGILYKETITEAMEGVGHYEPLRHYAEVHLKLEPLPRGSGMQFAADCREEVLDKNWQRLVLTHLEEKQHLGVLIGAPLTDVKITLIAGRAHLKHTEGGDFRQATYRAVRQGLMMADQIHKTQLLEPWYAFRLELPSDNVGRAMNDIQNMGGSFDPPETGADGDTTLLTGTAPASTMRSYPMEVVGYTRGRGHLTLTLDGYRPCHNAAEVIEAAGYEPEHDLDNPADSVFCAHGAGFVVPWEQVRSHMHVDSGWGKTAKTEEAVQARPRRMAAYRATLEEDAELLKIFEQTYGPIKRDPLAAFRPTQKQERPDFNAEQWEIQPEYLLVDGYNIIFAWDELNALSKESLEAARHRLMDILCNYQGFKKCVLILVFDAYRVPGSPGSIEQYHNIHVVYTREAETADMFIERVTHEIGKGRRVRVATSDGMEQVIILGHGALRVSARMFHEEVQEAEKEIRRYLQGEG
jgi:ribosomal protection tetracycline resistance protein